MAPSQQKRACPEPPVLHLRRRNNRQVHQLIAQASKLFLTLRKRDALKAFELKALYKILFKYLGLLSITIL
jgi:hypothetical protein